MTSSQSARIAIILYSLIITGSMMTFLILAQPLGMRFNYTQEQNFRLIDIILPTFVGYLGAASHFLFNSNRGREIEQENALMLKILVHGPFVIFIFVVSSLFFTHYITHRPLEEGEARQSVLDFNSLSRYLSICLAILAGTVSIISSYLFGPSPEKSERTKAVKAEI